MRKLLNGIIEFRNNIRPHYRDTFATLALGQFPDALFIGCSDSRVAVNVFASTDPGDLFVVRNVGNMVPPCGPDGICVSHGSEPAAIEFAVGTLKVAHIIVCGHSECGAIHAIYQRRKQSRIKSSDVLTKSSDSRPFRDSHLNLWLDYGEDQFLAPSSSSSNDSGKTINSSKSFSQFNGEALDVHNLILDRSMAPHNQLSQANVLHQMNHLLTYPIVKEQILSGKLRIHGWWFELKDAEVFFYKPTINQFVVLDENEASKILADM